MDYKIAIRNINYKSLLILVLLLPFSSQWITYFIALWVLTWILEGEFKLKIKKMRDWKLWLPISIIIINIISVFYSFDLNTSFSIIETQISLFLIPIIFISINQNYERKKNNILLAYIIGGVLLSVFLFYNIIYLNRSLFSNDLNLNNFLATANRFSSNYEHRSYLSLHLSLAIVIVLHLLEINWKSSQTFIMFLFIFLIILFSSVLIFLNSRAALLVLLSLTIYSLFKYLRNVKFWIGSLTLILIITGFSYLIMQSRLFPNINWLVQNLKIREGNNLYYNGDFDKGLMYWEPIAPDTIIHELIDTKYGKALRVERKNGAGWWSLAYKGRKIIYHKNLTYKLHFKIKLIKGTNLPFQVGWWVNEEGEYKNDLKIIVINIEEGWFDCTTSYTFNEDHQDLVSFINSQLSNSVFYITDIELTCNDTLNQPMFVDQIRDIRFSLWANALVVIKERPFFGYGIGDSKEMLLEVHQSRNIEEAVDREYNCHNQFLETATQTGFVGLIILLLVFAIPLYQSIKKKQELLFLFLMICFINFLFESMLERLAGVVFFAFWYSFLWFVYYKEDNPSKEITSSSNQQ